MSKFARTPQLVRSPITTVPGATRTFEGGAALNRDVKSDLFLLAVTNMVGEDTFYESASQRDSRFRDLVHQATIADPDWVARFVPYLRNSMQMRSASIVVAAESAWRRLEEAGQFPESTITTRQLVNSAISRLDEPAEFIAYWRSRFGRNLPQPVKRGIADAFTRLCNERSAIKYDGQRSAYRLGDVIEIVHPKPSAPWQSELFKWLLDRRRHDGAKTALESRGLVTIEEFELLRSYSPSDARDWLLGNPERLAAAGLTWEYLSGLGPMDAAAWEAVIPSMGYMALLRNLRNFDEAGISDEAAQQVALKLGDSVEVARSRQFPYRFLSAYRATNSLTWAPTLERALTLAANNVPELPGRTLFLADTSASMRNPVSAKSTVTHLDIAGLFAATLALRNPDRAHLVGFADGVMRLSAMRGSSVLRTMDALDSKVGSVGHGTNMLGAIQETFRGHDRIIICSDLQCAPYLGVGDAWARTYGTYSGTGVRLQDIVPPTTQVIAINTAGYAATPVDSSLPNYHEVGGFSDKVFTMVAMLGTGSGTDWPF